ncbi:MAG: anthranilate phosphoribosyltransferase [Nitrospira sp.]|nr:anthranilate phosphoribosyltransferase [Nitrospira sp.]MCA9465532.1 anthranilate phosphoribosyltransferase [Nitrospira sp.]MCA9481318.1 anthranilate phosphoribosyltransferase [Nitrospira sp.]MCB9711717.1 anthranilate phosphoribosyltransferase [Nitrospiraceae bacterium]MDR4488697.1 anthranilate phosphoribosyltransferase [Nitrospirales bacterium]
MPIEPMDQLIAKIGKGWKGAKDLTWEEAKRAFHAIVKGEATPTQVGAFLMAMRIKTESISELGAFTAAAREYVAPLQVPHAANMVDVPLYGEKHHTVHIIIAASLVATSAGAGMLLHGVDSPHTSSDLTRILALLGIPVALSVSDITQQLSQRAWVYADLAGYHAPLTRLLDLRREFGVQNLAHQVARLLNPARLPSQVIGIAHPPYLDKMAEALDMLGAKRALIIQGVEGFPELSISAPSTARELRSSHISTLTFRPQDAGLRNGPFQAMSQGAATDTASIPAQEAALIQALLTNRQKGDQRAWVIFNAALLIYAAGVAPSLAQATPLAVHALDSGKAGALLQSMAKEPKTQEQIPSSPQPVTVSS